MNRHDRYKIYYMELDENGNEIDRGVHAKDYAYLGTALNIARGLYGNRPNFKYEVAPRDPWQKYESEIKCGVCGETFTCEEDVHGNLWHARMFMYAQSKPRCRLRDFHAVTCPTCYDKILSYVKTLGGAENESTKN